MAAVLKLLERQLGLEELKRRLHDIGGRPGRSLENNVAYGPCLLVSRQRGSGGSQIAQLASDRLGWQMFDREIVNEIARLPHVRQQLMAAVGTQTLEAWDNSWQPELAPEDIGYEQYLRCLREVVLTLGHHGDVTILGRGAQCLLPAKCCLRVRVIAPFELRVARVGEQEKLSPELAKRCVEDFDAKRADFVKRCFRHEANTALNYDLVINTGEIPIPGAVDLVLLAIRNKLGVAVPRGQP